MRKDNFIALLDVHSKIVSHLNTIVCVSFINEETDKFELLDGTVKKKEIKKLFYRWLELRKAR